MTYSGNCRLGDLFTSRREKGRPGLPTLSVTLNDGLVNREDMERKQDTTLAPEEHLLVKPGDIAYNMMRMWQGAFGLADQEGLVSPAYVVLKANERVNPLYASHLLKTKRMIHLLWAYSHGLTEDRLRLYFQDFERIPATVPSIAEQQEIAQILNTWDNALRVTKALLDQTRRTKRSLMQKLLAPHHPADWKIYGWHRRPLSEVVLVDQESLSGNTPPDFRFRYISLAEVDEGTISTSLPTMTFESAPSRARRVVRHGDILMSTVRPNLKGYARVTERQAGCIASTGFAVLSSREDTNQNYIYQYLYSDDIQRQLNALVAGSNYPAISSADVEDLLINIPTSAVQAKIARLLDAHDNQLETITRQYELLLIQKAGLMQRLLSSRFQNSKLNTVAERVTL
jgi:type I restriction enzyme S subunit